MTFTAVKRNTICTCKLQDGGGETSLINNRSKSDLGVSAEHLASQMTYLGAFLAPGKDTASPLTLCNPSFLKEPSAR